MHGTNMKKVWMVFMKLYKFASDI